VVDRVLRSFALRLALTEVQRNIWEPLIVDGDLTQRSTMRVVDPCAVRDIREASMLFWATTHTDSMREQALVSLSFMAASTILTSLWDLEYGPSALSTEVEVMGDGGRQNHPGFGMCPG
jgi:hypothetical protein